MADSAHGDDDPSTTTSMTTNAPNRKPHLAGRTPGATVKQTPRKPGGRVMALLPAAAKAKAKETPDDEGERTPSKVKQTLSKGGQTPTKVKQTPTKVGQSPSKIKQTPRKPSGRAVAPVTPTTSKRKGDAAAAAGAAAASSGQPGSRTSGKKRGKGKEVTKDVVVRPLPAPKQLRKTGNSPAVVVKEEKEEEVSVAWSLRPWEEKMPHPFVRRSLFFDDPRFTFFD
ncbi:hypothetical protein SLS58_006396 [Diplodia intermedia]|uniref:Uncharacterized protein n=1 Tax=Diplodia intermedia TaxID=856260 RepID=A0ABR3TN72_9PEZI